MILRWHCLNNCHVWKRPVSIPIVPHVHDTGNIGIQSLGQNETGQDLLGYVHDKPYSWQLSLTCY